MAWWRAGVNQAWAIMEGERRIQRLIECSLDNQRMDEMIVLESISKEERHEKVEKLHEDVEIDIDWCVVESREHACLADLMEKLDMGFGADANIEMEEYRYLGRGN